MNPDASIKSESKKNIAMASVATLVIHASVVAGITWGGWLNVATSSSIVKPKHRLVSIDLSSKLPKVENIFVPVNREISSKKPPHKKTPFYSNANSIAANPETSSKPKDTPRIEDGDSLSPGTMHSPVQGPSATTPINQPNINQLVQPKSEQASPPTVQKDDIPAPDTPQTEKDSQDILPSIDVNQFTSRPKEIVNTKSILIPQLPALGPTLSEVKGGLGTRSRKQEGGVRRKGPQALDARGTGFGDYDARFFGAISMAWRKQTTGRSWSPTQVIVDFELYHDGRINKLVVRETRAPAILQYYCRKAIQGIAPFEHWTKEMRQHLGKGPRHCRITFNYLVR